MSDEVVLVLGAGMDEAGNLGEDGQASVRLALAEAQEHRSKYLIMSGDISYKSSYRPPTSEAQAMKDYAVSLGADSARILTEAESKDTFGNAFFSKVNLLLPLGIRKVRVIAGLNHSRERLSYIFDKVSGGSFTYQLVMHAEEREAEKEREAQSLQKLRDLFDDVRDGDDAAIYARMRDRHPAYRS